MCITTENIILEKIIRNLEKKWMDFIVILDLKDFQHLTEIKMMRQILDVIAVLYRHG